MPDIRDLGQILVKYTIYTKFIDSVNYHTTKPIKSSILEIKLYSTSILQVFADNKYS